MEQEKKFLLKVVLAVFVISLFLFSFFGVYMSVNSLNDVLQEEKNEIEKSEIEKSEIIKKHNVDTLTILSSEIENDLLILTNNERVLKLKNNYCLKTKARERAKQIVESGEFSHFYQGDTPYKKLIGQCMKWAHVGENLAKNFTSVELMHTGLMNSLTHKQNILGDYTQAGYGCYDNVCVQFFAK
jgi:uncharacterized protein YkwD